MRDEWANLLAWFCEPAMKSSTEELLKRAEEFEPKEALITQSFLAADLGLDGRSLAGNEARGGRRGSRNSQQDGLLRPQEVRRGDARARGANIEGSGEFDKLGTGGVRSPEEDGDLEPDSGGATIPMRIHANPLLELVNACAHSRRILVPGN